jgi:hypothetical protein
MRHFGGPALAAALVLIVQPALAQTASIDGDVVDADTGRGIAGARVRLQSGDAEPVFTAADALGHFRFTGQDFKSYGVEARAPGFIGSHAYAEEFARASVSLSRVSPIARVRLEMRRASAIVGKVTDALGVPLEGVTVSASERTAAGEGNNAGRPVRTAVTDDLGNYRIGPLPAGAYYVMVRPGSNYFLSQQPALRPPPDNTENPTFYPHALKVSDAAPIELAEGEEATADVGIVRRTGVTVSGRILSNGNVPADSFEAVNFFPRPMNGPSVPTSIEGDRFTAWNVQPGSYLVQASQNAGGEVITSAQRTIEVGQEDVQGIDFTLQPTPPLDVTVAYQPGCQAPAVIDMQSGSQRLRMLHAEGDASFHFDHVAPDKFRIYIQPDGPARVFAVAAKLGDADALADGFEVTAETKTPLRITIGCGRR